MIFERKITNKHRTFVFLSVFFFFKWVQTCNVTQATMLYSFLQFLLWLVIDLFYFSLIHPFQSRLERMELSDRWSGAGVRSSVSGWTALMESRLAVVSPLWFLIGLLLASYVAEWLLCLRPVKHKATRKWITRKWSGRQKKRREREHTTHQTKGRKHYSYSSRHLDYQDTTVRIPYTII